MEGPKVVRFAERYLFVEAEFEEATKVKEAINLRIAVQKGVMRMP